MNKVFGFRLLPGLAMSLALASLSGCAAIEAQKLAGEGNRLIAKDQQDQAVEKFKASIARSDNDAAHAGMAQAYLRQGNYAAAQKEAETAIEMSKGFAGANFTAYKLILARALLLQNQGTQAFEAVNGVIRELRGNMADPPTKEVMKEATLLRARIIEATSNPADALKVINDPDAQLRWPEDADFRAELAIVEAMTKQLNEAQAHADWVLQRKPQDGDALMAKAMVLAQSGKVAEAKQLISTPLREDHTRVMVFLAITRELMNAKKFDDAIELLTMLSEVQPANHVIHSELAIIYYDLGKVQESIKEHQLILKTFPSLQAWASKTTIAELEAELKANPPGEKDRENLWGNYMNLGELHLKAKEPDKAIDVFQRAVAVKPTKVAYQNLAAIYDQKGDTPNAMAAMENALKQDPNDAELLKNLGTLAFKAGQSDKAIDLLKKAVTDKPEDPRAHLNLGVVLFMSQKYKESVTEFKEAVRLQEQLGQDSVEAAFNLGVAQNKAGDKKGAEETFKKVIEVKKDHADAYRELGQLALDRKDYKTAEKFFQQEDQLRGKTPSGKKKK